MRYSKPTDQAAFADFTGASQAVGVCHGGFNQRRWLAVMLRRWFIDHGAHKCFAALGFLWGARCGCVGAVSSSGEAIHDLADSNSDWFWHSSSCWFALCMGFHWAANQVVDLAVELNH